MRTNQALRSERAIARESAITCIRQRLNGIPFRAARKFYSEEKKGKPQVCSDWKLLARGSWRQVN